MLEGVVGAGIGAAANYFNSWSTSSGPLARGSNTLSQKQYERQVKTDTKYQALYDTWKSALDYQYAQKYAQNSARWNVEGLLAAGLNPILAATDGNFKGTFGTPSSGSPSSHGSNKGMARGFDTALSMASLANAAKQVSLLDAQEEQIRSQTAKLNQETENARETGGLSGGYGALHSALTKLGLIRGDTSSGKSVRVLDKDGKPIGMPYEGSEIEVPRGAYRSNSAKSAFDRIQLDKMTSNKLEAIARDLGLWFKSGAFFGTPASRQEVVRQRMDRYYDRKF